MMQILLSSPTSNYVSDSHAGLTTCLELGRLSGKRGRNAGRQTHRQDEEDGPAHVPRPDIRYHPNVDELGTQTDQRKRGRRTNVLNRTAASTQTRLIGYTQVVVGSRTTLIDSIHGEKGAVQHLLDCWLPLYSLPLSPYLSKRGRECSSPFLLTSAESFSRTTFTLPKHHHPEQPSSVKRRSVVSDEQQHHDYSIAYHE